MLVDATKVPAAVVYLERSDGRVLALTRGDDFSDWHLPGGKWETGDGMTITGPVLRATAVREVREETGVVLAVPSLQHLVEYTTRSGRHVQAYRAPCPAWCPTTFPRNPAGQPAWVPPGMLTLPWSSFGPECQHVLDAIEGRP